MCVALSVRNQQLTRRIPWTFWIFFQFLLSSSSDHLAPTSIRIISIRHKYYFSELRCKLNFLEQQQKPHDVTFKLSYLGKKAVESLAAYFDWLTQKYFLWSGSRLTTHTCAQLSRFEIKLELTSTYLRCWIEFDLALVSAFLIHRSNTCWWNLNHFPGLVGRRRRLTWTWRNVWCVWRWKCWPTQCGSSKRTICFTFSSQRV